VKGKLKHILVEQGTARLEPLSGQFVLNFETRELAEGIRFIAHRSAEDWLAVALSFEADSKTKSQAIEAYDRCVAVDPQNANALLNCGTLYYEDGNFEKGAEHFQRALAAQQENPLAHFNLGSVLEEIGKLEEARRHLRQAVLLDPNPGVNFGSSVTGSIRLARPKKLHYAGLAAGGGSPLTRFRLFQSQFRISSTKGDV
jgi:tetratricopeptide (TPR) repeat protein